MGHSNVWERPDEPVESWFDFVGNEEEMDVALGLFLFKKFIVWERGYVVASIRGFNKGQRLYNMFFIWSIALCFICLIVLPLRRLVFLFYI